MELDNKLINLIERLDADKHNLLLWKEFFSLLFEEELAKNNEEILVNLLSVQKYVQTCSMALCFISLFHNKESYFQHEVARKEIESDDNWLTLKHKLFKIGIPEDTLLQIFSEKSASFPDNPLLCYCRGNLLMDMNDAESAKIDF